MAIINTLITARDQTSDVIKKTAKNVKDATNDMKKSMDGAANSADYLEGSFDNFRNIDTSSFSGFIESIRKIQEQMDNAEDSTAKFLIRMGAAAGGMTALSYVILSAVGKSSEYVNSMNDIATATGTSIERLQQMQSVFRGVGISIEKFGDINKDVLDHLGDAFRDGSGPAGDMKALGLQLDQYNKYLNQTNGGLNAVIHSYYELRNAGKSQAEIVNLMETMGSDSSHLIGILKGFGSEAEALNAIQSRHAGITAEVAEKYKDYQNKIDDLKVQFMAFQADALSPTVDELNFLLDILNNDWEGTKFTKWMKDFYYGGDNIVSKMIRSIDGVDPATISGTKENKAFVQMSQNPPAPDPEAPKGGWVDQDKLKAAADAAKKKAEAAAAAFKRQQEEAQKWIAQLDINNATESKKAELNYDLQLKKLDEYQQKKLISQADYNHAVSALNTQLDEVNRKEIENRQLEAARNSRDQGLTTEYEYQEKILNIRRDYQIRAIEAEYYTEMERLDYKHQAGLLKEQEYQDQLAGIRAKRDYEVGATNKTTDANLTTNKYKEQAETLERYSSTMTSVTNLASQMGATIAASAEQGSAAWVAATVVTKAAAVAQAIIAANLAAAQVMASPSSLTLAQKVAESNTIRVMGYASAAMIAAQGIAEIAGKRERGGGVQAGKSYLVGEKGPEVLTMGANSGNITSNKALAGMGGGSAGGGTFTQVNHFYQSGLGQDDINLIKVSTEALFDKKINDEMRGGGKLATVRQ